MIIDPGNAAKICYNEPNSLNFGKDGLTIMITKSLGLKHCKAYTDKDVPYILIPLYTRIFLKSHSILSIRMTRIASIVDFWNMHAFTRIDFNV